MKVKLLIFFFLLLNLALKAQYLTRENDTVFFGPGLRMLDKRGKFRPEYDIENGCYRRDLRYQELRLFVRYRYGYNTEELLELARKRSDFPIEWDSLIICSVKSAFLGDIPCEIIKFKCRPKKKYDYRFTLFRHHYYAIKVDTTVHNIIDVCAYQAFERRRTRRRMLRKFSSLELVNIENYPPGFLLIAPQADSIMQQSLLGKNKFRDVGLLKCMSVEAVQSNYNQYYLPVMDTLMQQFEYEKVNALLRQQFELKYMKDWNDYKQFLQTEFARYGDVSVQHEYEIRKKMIEGKIGLDDFLNYSVNNGHSSVFDTLCRIHLRHSAYPDVIAEQYADYEFINSAFVIVKKLPEFPSPQDILNESDVRLKIEEDLRNYIYCKYLGGKGEQPTCLLLHESARSRLYVYQNINSTDSLWNMVSINEIGNSGHWQVRVSKLDDKADPVRMNKAIYFNGLTTLVADYHHLVIDTTDGELRYTFISPFPDLSNDYYCEVFVRNNTEIFEASFPIIAFNNPKAFEFKEVHEITSGFWKQEGPYDTEEENYVLRCQDPDKVVYLAQQIADLNQDGVMELFSFGISNGRAVYTQCYTVANHQLVKLQNQETLDLLGNCSLFNNLLKYSSIK